MTPAEKAAAAKPPRKIGPVVRRPGRQYPWSCRLRECRQHLRLSLKDVAKGTGLSITAVHEIEKGSDPQLTTAVRLAQFFGLTVGEIWPKRRSKREGDKSCTR